MSIIKRITTAAIILIVNLFSQQSFAQFTPLENFNANPGNLSASYFVPNTGNATIVVLLHGCVQQGEELAKQSGLLGLAKKHQFALLIPQQNLNNNIKRCFNWYSAEDYGKNVGENLSIKNMILTLKQQLGSQDIYILGLSGGGAMASSMLVNYPELFNAGAIVAGLPFPCADGLITAISCMKNGPSQTAVELTQLVTALNPQQSIWPKLSVWTGQQDAIVNPMNSMIFAQHWVNLTGIADTPNIEQSAEYTITTWKSNQEEPAVELVVVANLGHGIMVNPTEENGGEVADYLLSSSISTAKHIIDFWQLPIAHKKHVN